MSGHPAATGLPAHAHRRFLLGLVLLTLFAWLLREYFVAVTIVEVPIRGDIRQYVAYAWNILNHGTFSHVWPGSGPPVPDTFRGPGYPVLLAGLMWLDPHGWYQLALHVQAMLGALTVAMTVLLARHWLSSPWAFGAGALMAVWPHHVAATGALLTEVAFGFLLVLALLLTVEALKKRSTTWAAAGGLAFSMAALTSMVSLLFPVFAAVVFKRSLLAKAAAVLLLMAAIGPAAWSLRGLAVDTPATQPGRITMNLVQGSWPLYHQAYASRNAHPVAHRITVAIDEEIAELAATPAEGLETIRRRIAHEPGRYLRWYLVEKPFLLWDWNMGLRAGTDGVYFHAVSHSPLETQPVLHAIKVGLQYANPLIFWLSAIASFTLVVAWLFGNAGRVSLAAVLVAGLCIYVTLVHVVLQAEPRYSIPYRPMQVMMLATALAWVADRLFRRTPAPANL